MNPCDKISDETFTLLAFGDEAPEAAEHLTGCDHCRARLDLAREELGSVRAAAALTMVEPPADLVRGLKARAAKVAGKRRGRRLAWWLAPLPIAAAAAFIFLVLSPGPEDQHLASAPARVQIPDWATQPDLDSIQNDLDQGLKAMGLEADEPENDLGRHAVEAENQPPAFVSDDTNNSLDQLEVALAKLEQDLGVKPAGQLPAEGE